MPSKRWRSSSAGDQPPFEASASQHSMLLSRTRSALPLLVAGVVVVLTALGFHALATNRTPAHSSHTLTAGATTTPVASVASGPKNQWIPSASLRAAPGAMQGNSALPAVAPSNPVVLYQLAASKGQVRRSADHGKSWQSQALPERLADGVNLYVSPLDANTLFLSARYQHPPQDGAQCVETPENTPPAAGYECVAQWISVDGGAHWTTPHYPLGAPLADLAPVFWAGGPEFVQAQGHALFGALYCHEPLCGNTGYRIVRSEDGGLTWQFADAAITAAHQYACDVTAETQGATLFAVSAPISCTTALDQSAYGGGYGSFRLWRSDDSGRHWSELGTLPAAVGGHLLVEPAPAGVQPLLYGTTSSPVASVDGGLTWHTASNVGLPPNARIQVLGVQRDGSLVVGALSASSATGKSDSETIYRWRAGDVSWQQVGQSVAGIATSFTATVDASGQETLWLTVPMGPFSTPSNGQMPIPSSYQIESLLQS